MYMSRMPPVQLIPLCLCNRAKNYTVVIDQISLSIFFITAQLIEPRALYMLDKHTAISYTPALLKFLHQPINKFL